MTSPAVFVVDGGAELRGRIRVPGDKSISHRALLIAALADGPCHVRGLSDGDDVTRTATAVEAMGVTIDGTVVAGGRGRLHEPGGVIDVGNSGTGIRLLAGFAAQFPWLTVLTGDHSIATRPMARVVDPLRSMGAVVDGRDDGRLAPLTIRGGGLKAIEYTPPIPSAQVKSAILLAALSADGETVVHERHATRVHTEELLSKAGVNVEATTAPDGSHTVRLEPGRVQAFSIDIPGDPSQAAFWVVAASIVPGSDLTIENVYVGPTRAGFLDVLRRMGADIDVQATGSGDDQTVADIHVRYAPLTGTEVRGDEVPGLDEIPVLAVAAAVADGVTVFHHVADLRMKESDRIDTTASELGALGGRVETTTDSLTVVGGSPLRGADVRSHGDHRIAMSMAVAALAARGSTRIHGWDAVATSYPGFEKDLDSCR